MLSALVERGWGQLSSPGGPGSSDFGFGIGGGQSIHGRGRIRRIRKPRPRNNRRIKTARGMVLKAEGRAAEAAAAFVDHADHYKNDTTARSAGGDQ